MRKQKRLTTTKSNAGTKCQQADDLVIFYKMKRKLGIWIIWGIVQRGDSGESWLRTLNRLYFVRYQLSQSTSKDLHFSFHTQVYQCYRWLQRRSNMKYELKIPSEMEVAPRYDLVTLFTLLKLLYTAKTLACMPVLYWCGRRKRYWNRLAQVVAKSVNWWYPLECYDY